MVFLSKTGIQLFYCIYFITSIVTTDEYIDYIVPIVNEVVYL